MKKILIFSLAYYPKHVGGAEVAIKEITDRISPEEIEFHMITNRYDSTLPKVEQVGNVLVHRIGFSAPLVDTKKTHNPLFYLQKILFIPQATVRTFTLNRTHQYDGFWGMMAYMTFPIALLRLVGLRKPYVLTLQEGDPFTRVFKRWYIALFVPLLRYGFKNASVIQAISTFLKTWAVDMGYTKTVAVIPNGVDTAHFAQELPLELIQELERKLGKKKSDIFLVTTSRLVSKNAVDDVIRALPKMPSNVHFVVFGTGPDEDILKQLAYDKGVKSRVHFRGFIDHKDMSLYLKACDIFIRPSRSEGMGNSFVEAMVAELPVIATQEGGIADFLFDEKRNPDKETTGWAVDKDNPEQIAKAVKDIIDRPEKVTHVLKTAKKLAEEKYDWNLIAGDMQKKVFSHV